MKKIENPEESHFPGFLNRLFNAGLAVMGCFIYKGLVRKYPGHMFFIDPACSAGDMIFFRYMFDELLKQSGAEKYLLILDNGGVYRSASELGYDDLYPVSRMKLKALFVYYCFEADSLDNVMNVYPWMMFDYKSAASFSPRRLRIECDKSRIEKLFAENGLVRGKTVILSPYEQSISAMGLPKLSPLFWERLAKELASKGFCVCTNCAGNDDEPVIKGTVRIFPKFSEMESAAEYAGGMIAVRSGVADYISHADAVKVILYPDKDFYNMWNLERVCNTDRCGELIYENDTDGQNGLLAEILGYFPDRGGE